MNIYQVIQEYAKTTKKNKNQQPVTTANTNEQKQMNQQRHKQITDPEDPGVASGEARNHGIFGVPGPMRAPKVPPPFNMR